MSQTELTPEDEEWDFVKARAKLAPKLDGRKAARKNRQKRLANAVDGRSLRATGRTEHLNFKATAANQSRLGEACSEGDGKPLARGGHHRQAQGGGG